MLPCLHRRFECWLTYVTQVDQAVLADVWAGTGLRPDDAATALLVADDAKLWRLDTTRQVHVEHRAQFLQQLHTNTHTRTEVSGPIRVRFQCYCARIQAQNCPWNLSTKSMLKVRDKRDLNEFSLLPFVFLVVAYLVTSRQLSTLVNNQDYNLLCGDTVVHGPWLSLTVQKEACKVGTWKDCGCVFVNGCRFDVPLYRCRFVFVC